MLSSALDQLIAKQYSGFTASFKPGERAKYGSFIRRAPYFTTILKYELGKEFIVVEGNTAEVLTTFHYPKGYIGTLRIHLEKHGTKWFIDFDKTYKWETRSGGDNWRIMKFQ